QRVHRRVELAWRREDWRRLPAAEQDERWRELAEEADRGFDLARAPLMCLSLIRLADDRYRFSWSYHHLLLDGWSASRVVQELFEHYKALAAGDELRMGEPAPFRDYVAWLADQDPAAAESYWRRTLEGFSGPTLLTAGSFGRALERTAAPGYGDAEQWLSESASDALRALAQGRRLTLNAIFQAAWAVILSRTSGSDDVVFGVTVSGRPATLAGVEAMVGMFINTLPLRLSVPSQAALLSWLGEVRDRQAELSRFEHTPLAELLRWCRIPSARPLFDSLLVFENYPVKPAMTAGSGQRVGVGDVEVGLRANYPFTLVVNPGPRIHLRVAYDQRRLDAVTVGRVLG
ncbi:MAG: non-ribosomal peptide synthetase, partial [bacterium]|nr:non-ribosomal peptide synthetase [bacterium]